MKYDKKYKRVGRDGKNGGMFYGKEMCGCSFCNDMTLWIEPTFKAPVCSDECYSALMNEYVELTSMGARVIMD